MVKGCTCSYDGVCNEVNSRIFDGEPFCDVNLHSSCPDLLIYTNCVDQKCSKRRVSAEACKESPNHFGMYSFSWPHVIVLEIKFVIKILNYSG